MRQKFIDVHQLEIVAEFSSLIKELRENNIIKALGAQIRQIKTTNEAKVQVFGCKSQK